MPNTSSSRTIVRKIYFILVPAALVFVLLGVYTASLWHQGRIDNQMAEQADLELTKEHGDEAREAVTYFEQTWMSWEMQQDTKTYLDKLLTGPLLQYYLEKVSLNSGEQKKIPYQIEVDNLRVVEYNIKSMRVVACLRRGINKVGLNGDVIEKYPIRSIINFYVFIHDGDFWKVGSVLDITDPKQALQDWDYLPQDIKDLTGDIENYIYKSCQIEE